LCQHGTGEAEAFRCSGFANGFGERIGLGCAGRIDEAVHPDHPAGMRFQDEEGEPCPGINGRSPITAGLPAMAAAIMPSGSSQDRIRSAILNGNGKAWTGRSKIQMVMG